MLYAVRADDGQIRAYRIDQINGASVTSRVFTPRFQVELTPTGVISPVTQTVGSGTSLGLPSARTGASIRRRASSPRSGTRSAGSTYIYRCPFCDKTFRRKTKNSRLKPHKTKDGWPCPGRTGYYEDTIY